MSAAVNNYANTGGATTTPATNLPANGRTTASLVLDDRLGHTREVGNQATWSLSSCKPGMKIKYLTETIMIISISTMTQFIKRQTSYFIVGFGVEQLRDGTHETYWQSDGQLPHLVNICFKRKTTVSAVAVYTDFRLDESYTPSKISVRYVVGDKTIFIFKHRYKPCVGVLNFR